MNKKSSNHHQYSSFDDYELWCLVKI